MEQFGNSSGNEVHKQGQPKTYNHAQARFDQLPPTCGVSMESAKATSTWSVFGCPCLLRRVVKFMEATIEAPDKQSPDSYHIWVPIEDHDLLKSVDVDENGDYIVQGVMTSDDVDEEKDSIDPEGMDCSYFLEKGWIKYEHGNRPEQFIGEPLEIRVGRFEHPTLKKSVHGIFVKGRLFANRELARQAVKTIQDLQKSNTKRRMGWSIEGHVKERCRKTGKILKSMLRNVVLTMNPVNTMTWVELAKSFAKNHQLEINMEETSKSMDTDALHAITPQSIEGYEPEKDPQEEWIKLFRKFVRENALKKSLRNKFITSTGGEIGVSAYIFAKQNGLDYKEAVEFASYIAEKQAILKSLFGKIGGETMSDQAKSMLASLLDTELEELQKSLELEDDEAEEELQKSAGADDDSEDDSNDEDMNDDEDTDDEDSDADDDEDADDEDSDEDDDEDVEKSFGSSLRKSLSEEHGQAQAFEVSEFLTALVDELGYGMEGLQKSLMHMTKQQRTIVKSLSTVVTALQEVAQRMETLEAENEDLRKSLGEVLNRPIGRKSVVNQREVTTITKSMGTAEQGKPMTKVQVMEILEKSFEAGELSGSEVIRFNNGVPLEKLNLPPSVKAKLGLA